MKSKMFNYLTIILILFLIGCSVPKEWMQKNLDVDHYRNGDPIPQVTDPIQWSNLKTGAWCYYNNDYKNDAIYGKLYNWYAVNDSRGLAPVGWHIPNNAEWIKLITHHDGSLVFNKRSNGNDIWNNAGANMKEKGTNHWNSPNTGAKNEKGFSALPGGYRTLSGKFGHIGINGSWWSSTSDGDPNKAWNFFLYYDSDCIRKSDNAKLTGFSIRCVKDE